MKKIAVLLIGILMQGCFSFDETEYIIDPQLKDSIESFYKEAESHGIIIPKENLILQSSESIGSRAGLSEKKKGQRIVSISKYIVESDNAMRLNIIVFHELGHALLQRNHYDGEPSIMNTSPCVNCDLDKYYLNELFMPHK